MSIGHIIIEGIALVGSIICSVGVAWHLVLADRLVQRRNRRLGL